MRRMSEIVEQDLNSRVRKRLTDQPHNAHVILQKFICIVGDLFAVVFLEQLRVNLLFGRLKLTPHIVLLADENELSRCRMIFVFEEIVHPQPEIFQAEFAKVFARDGERVEIVLVEVFAKLALPLLVFAPQKTEAQEEQRYNDRSDDVDRKLTLQGIDHSANILFTAVPSACRSSSETAGHCFETAHRAVATNFAD